MPPHIWWNIYECSAHPFGGANWWLLHPAQSPGVCHAQPRSITLTWFVAPYSEAASPSIQHSRWERMKKTELPKLLQSPLFLMPRIIVFGGYCWWMWKCCVSFKLDKQMGDCVSPVSIKCHSFHIYKCVGHRVMIPFCIRLKNQNACCLKLDRWWKFTGKIGGIWCCQNNGSRFKWPLWDMGDWLFTQKQERPSMDEFENGEKLSLLEWFSDSRE